MDKYLKKIDAATILAALYASLVWVAYFYLNITPDISNYNVHRIVCFSTIHNK